MVSMLKTVYICIDEHGTEQEKPSWKEADKDSGKMARPKWDAAAEHGRRQKRARSDSYYDRPEAPPTPPSTDLPMRQFARHGEVLISRIELDHLIDGIDRTVSNCEHCSHYAKTAASVFDTSSKALKAAKHIFERLRRS